jgi:hypothetical protein
MVSRIPSTQIFTILRPVPILIFFALYLTLVGVVLVALWPHSEDSSCWILTGLVTPGAQMDGMKVSDCLSDVACSLSYIYLAVE